MSHYRIVGEEAECEKGSNGLVLRNRLGITDPDEMARVEQRLLRQLHQAVLRDPACLLSSWHGRWMGNIYSWAGAQRTVNILICYLSSSSSNSTF